MIQKLDLCMEGLLLHFPRRNWPRHLELYVRDMPNLSQFKLYSEWSVEDDEIDVELDGEGEVTVTRSGYCRSRLLRFLSFLIFRHTSLNLLIWPAKCQARRQIESDMITEWFVAERKSSSGRRWETAVQPMAWSLPQDWGIESDGSVEMVSIRHVEDQILDSRVIRRLLERELAESHPVDLILEPAQGMTKDETLSSESPEPDTLLNAIDHNAYRDERSPRPDDMIARYRWEWQDGQSGLRGRPGRVGCRDKRAGVFRGNASR